VKVFVLLGIFQSFASLMKFKHYTAFANEIKLIQKKVQRLFYHVTAAGSKIFKYLILTK
jgi:hypothetical protein